VAKPGRFAAQPIRGKGVTAGISDALSMAATLRLCGVNTDGEGEGCKCSHQNSFPHGCTPGCCPYFATASPAQLFLPIVDENVFVLLAIRGRFGNG
jgi:hypothetical protein